MTLLKQLLLCLTFAVLSPNVMSQESGEETATSSEESSESGNEDRQQSADDETEPDAGNLRQKELGEAFEQFTPSEEISADNAVPFPTDI